MLIIIFTLYIKVIGIACLFLASKVEETPKKLRYFVKIAIQLKKNIPDPDSKELDELEEKVLVAEKLVLKTIAFDLTIIHPYNDLIAYLKKFELSNNTISQVSWNIINDT